jgi:molybdopterin converting factor small subunit
MRIHVKLMATLRGKLPPEAKGSATLDLESGTTLRAVLHRLQIREGSVHVVMVNEEMEPDRERELNDGDSLVLIPPIAGG